ncbi:MAG: DUF447 domain-containing protein [Pseudodesulfovibrio sp.]|uniref:DUF447 domain-containing protein n=1 Tax=Pseudodesulfovibrio sp. TaxID=2035812 RepID=UPI003D14EA69
MTDSRLHSLRPGWIYEVVVTARLGEQVTAGPFGIWTNDGATLEAALFKGSSTLEAIRESGCLVVNFVDDPLDLHAALNRRDELVFDAVPDGEAQGWPLLAGAPSWLALRVGGLEDAGKKMLLTAEIVDASEAGPGTLINRAKGLFLESLILSTRCRLLGWAAVDQLRENVRVIAKVAPGSDYETAVRELLAKVESEC